jgi:hypothetical protein
MNRKGNSEIVRLRHPKAALGNVRVQRTAQHKKTDGPQGAMLVGCHIQVRFRATP